MRWSSPAGPQSAMRLAIWSGAKNIAGPVSASVPAVAASAAGWPAVVTLMLGLLLPSLLHGAHDHCQPHRPPGVFLGLALGALGLHAMLDGVATVKTLQKKDGQVWLLPHNDAYDPIDGTYATILGKVTAVLRRM